MDLRQQIPMRQINSHQDMPKMKPNEVHRNFTIFSVPVDLKDLKDYAAEIFLE
jgi:hypothetical protein